jgi:hypothetical protein
LCVRFGPRAWSAAGLAEGYASCGISSLDDRYEPPGEQVSQGFVLNNGAFTTVDVPDMEGNAQQTEINSINVNGEIVGFYVDSKENGTHHGFLGVPVP